VKEATPEVAFIEPVPVNWNGTVVPALVTAIETELE
jgi:hypothetical protein